MAGRPRKPIEEKIAEKEELENLNDLIVSAGLDVEEAAQALEDYISLREQEVS